MMVLTNGEKMVWSATYATQRTAGHKALEAIRMAWAAVHELRSVKGEVNKTFGYGAAREMYDDVMGRQ